MVKRLRVNERIQARTVRVIDGDGAQVGVLSLQDARRMADEKGLDLVEVSPTANPPVCRIMDYGRYKYLQEKKEHESRKHQTVIHLKEVKFRPKIGEHDLRFKVRNIRKFLDRGDRVKVTVMFRGREIMHTELGEKILLRVAEELEDIAVVDQQARLEGRNFVLMLAPKK